MAALSPPIVLGRDHHDALARIARIVRRQIFMTARFTADMAVQNFVGDAFRGATWVSLHNGGGVGWGEVAMAALAGLDGSADAAERLQSMLHWDVNNGIARRAWARNEGAQFPSRKP